MQRHPRSNLRRSRNHRMAWPAPYPELSNDKVGPCPAAHAWLDRATYQENIRMPDLSSVSKDIGLSISDPEVIQLISRRKFNARARSYAGPVHSTPNSTGLMMVETCYKPIWRDDRGRLTVDAYPTKYDSRYDEIDESDPLSFAKSRNVTSVITPKGQKAIYAYPFTLHGDYLIHLWTDYGTTWIIGRRIAGSNTFELIGYAVAACYHNEGGFAMLRPQRIDTAFHPEDLLLFTLFHEATMDPAPKLDLLNQCLQISPTKERFSSFGRLPQWAK